MDLLIEHEKYLEAGVHIGTRIATKDIQPFIYKYRKDKLCMLNIEQVDMRIRDAAQFLAQNDTSNMVIVASRVYAIPAAKKFAEIIGAKVHLGRFIPGSFTNPALSSFVEPTLVFVCDPRIEKQALIEATQLGIPTIGLVDSDNVIRYLDFFIPCNNKGKKSIPLVFYLLTREFMKAKGQISSNEEFKYSISDFGYEEGEGTLEAGESQEAESEAEGSSEIEGKAELTELEDTDVEESDEESEEE